jgi:anti-sigma factor RsiW
MANDTGDDRTKRTEIDAALDAALARLPRHAAPAALARRIRQQFNEPSAPRPVRGWIAQLASAFAAAALVVVVVRFVPPARDAGVTAAASAGMVSEAVNDHLRVVSSSRPVEIESGGIHQVKPWFTGRLEFAPRVTFSGDDEFPMVGGSVGYFLDRKAAVFVFKRRLHVITLLVFPDAGLPWPASGLVPVGGLSVSEHDARGFSVLLWQDAGLGYALISDVNRHDLESLAARINRQP